MLQFYCEKSGHTLKRFGLVSAACFALSSTTCFAQGRLVLNGDVVVNIHGGTDSNTAYIVMDNSNANAISSSGNGRLNSEGQYNILQWNVADGSGTYTVPFADNSGTPLPVSLVVSTAGSNDGVLRFATYGTGQDNLPLPQGVASLGHQDIPGDALPPPAANGNKVYDRFWFVAPTGYTTAPGGNMSITYSTAAMNGDLVAGSTALAAQSHNGTAWSALQSGTDNLLGSVSSIPFSNGNFSSVWTLVENGAPLNISLLDFQAVWSDARKTKADVTWQTASEENNDYFVLERSTNGLTWEFLAQKDGAGTTTQLQNYSWVDINPLEGTSYYRLKQVDFDGTYSYSHVVSLNKELSGAQMSVYPNPAQKQFQIALSGVQSDNAVIRVMDNTGRLVEERQVNPQTNPVQIMNADALESGVYQILVTTNGEVFSSKIVIKN